MPSTEFTHLKQPVTIDPNWLHVVERLVQARHTLSLSQEALAHKIGCASSLIHKWEQHKRLPSGFMFLCWLEALDCEIEIKRRDTTHM
jgi:DNA-binding transcriptional regulator YiaG